MTGWRTRYWRLYNVLVRALGMNAVLFGTGYVGWGAFRLAQLGLQPAEGAPGVTLVATGLLAAGLGAAILNTPAYRPDLGDPACEFDPFGSKTRQSPRARRSWWTGDPLISRPAGDAVLRRQPASH